MLYWNMLGVVFKFLLLISEFLTIGVRPSSVEVLKDKSYKLYFNMLKIIDLTSKFINIIIITIILYIFNIKYKVPYFLVHNAYLFPKNFRVKNRGT